MPYSRTLREYVLPEFEELPSDSWEKRLREISPVLPNLAHLRLRKFEPRPDWYCFEPDATWPARPIWVVYSCTPRHLVTAERAVMFAKHWSELPTDQQVGRRSLVSNYQHFMWHSQGVEVRPFWVLQGDWGGTPTMYTPREKRYLDASGALSEPFPIGFFPACPFDERAVKGILARDRLIQAGNRYDALEKMDRPEYLKAEDEAAEVVFRETYLDTLAVMHAPAVEFMKSQLGKAAVNDALPPAPKGLENTLAQWKDVWRSEGRIIGINSAPMRKKAQVSVA